MSSSTLAPWRLFWAKTDRSGARPEWTRPLWAHLIDVANAALVLWERGVPSPLKARLAAAAGLSVDDAGRWFSLQIGLHDWGKAIPSFQRWHEGSCEMLKAQGLTFPASYDSHNSIHHGHATTSLTWRKLDRDGVSGPLLYTLRGLTAMIGFHHGKLVPESRLYAEDAFGINLKAILGEEGTWGKAQDELYKEVVEAWNAPAPTLQGEKRRWPTWIMGVGGWCTLADWLGSMAEHYPDDVAHGDDLVAYIERSRAGAERAYEAAALNNRAALIARPFTELFRRDDSPEVVPRPLQEECIALPIDAPTTPTLTIIEAPTGEGKTEAALVLAARQQEKIVGGGVYIAMPSQATSNGLFLRFADFLRRAHDDRQGAVNLVLIHGNSALNEEQEKLVRAFLDARRQFSPIYSSDDTDAGDRARVETADWFLPKKRSLLAPYGIGTVDQVLLGVLYAKHFFLRLYGLAGKTVIFDEVHAYDTYMNTLFGRLLAWLREAGAHVIVLSATLPSATRRAIEQAWSNSNEPVEEGETSPPPYPALWHRTSASKRSDPICFKAALGQSAIIEWGNPEVTSVAAQVVTAARAGAAVAVIVNTVARAQKVYEAVRTLLGSSPIECTLFHARFPFGRRAEIERSVLERFGRSRESCVPRILVATQVAEQSLDLDVDLMFSDLAPIDLLLQRAGRLHRHRHHLRPTGCEQPRLIVLCPLVEEGAIPKLDMISGRGYVYHHAVLLRTWHLLRNRTGWSLPDDYRPLIEGVYSNLSAPPPEEFGLGVQETWLVQQEKFMDKATGDRGEAHQRMIPPPDEFKSVIEARHLELTEDDDADPRLHEHYRALTRLGELSIEAVCLHQSPEGRLYLDPDLTQPLPSALPLSRAVLRSLQECVVKLSGKRLLTLIPDMVHRHWTPIAKETPGLMQAYPLVFQRVVASGVERFYWHGTYGTIEYSNELGIIHHKPMKEDADGDI